ncbi:MAG: DUF819 family protein [Lachnospiraceae bacterium]|nr:DUF819 family protein [Lachnospiraceae bacterium]
MITSTIGFYAFIFAAMAITFSLCKKYENTKVVQVLPAIVWLFLFMAICSTFKVYDTSAEGVKTGQNIMYSTFLPMMLTMFMLTCDIRKVIKLGPRMILAFLLSSLSIMIGFTVAFLLCKGFLPENGWASIAATTGSFIGETINMVAVAGVFGVEGVDYAYSVMMVTFAFTIFMTVMMMLIRKKDAWNKFMKANTDTLDDIAKRIAIETDPDVNTCTLLDYCKLFAIALCGTWAINSIIPIIPPVTFLNATGWRVVMSSILGIILGVTPMRKLHGATECANVFLYACMCVTASYSDLTQCTKAPGFLLVCVVMLIVMFSFWVLFAKIFKFDLFTAEVALTANIGGTASAPLIAATHNPNWISFGILMGFFGDIVGTGLAILFGHFLKFLSML